MICGVDEAAVILDHLWAFSAIPFALHKKNARPCIQVRALFMSHELSFLGIAAALRFPAHRHEPGLLPGSQFTG